MAPRRLPKIVADPFARSLLVGGALVAGGLVAIGLGWRGAAASVLVPNQLAFLLSGGIGGILLVVTGCAVVAVQSSRYWNARERRAIDDMLASAARALERQAGGGVTSRLNAPPR
jgi:hypothetical protein